MRPRIGINCDLGDKSQPRSFLYSAYIDAVWNSGGLPLLLAPVEDPALLLDLCDGLLLTGGDDYRLANDQRIPQRFTPVAERRERFDIALIEAARQRELPVLGICCGFQLQVLQAGGSLHGDLEELTDGEQVLHRHRRRRAEDPLAVHPIEWTPGRLFAEAPAGSYEVNSHHHQAVRMLPDGWRVLARSEDGLIEAAAGPGSFDVGVQWHPEKDADGAPGQQILTMFVTHAARVRSTVLGSAL